jgi:2-polyprenyl-3-methyl-5-hydroxy-6-metoxy-1,4-benzoquinol methylase|tara:strand:+ start:3840 stop:4652 length:813 start_codon:yes stop_codon:yes gene_type:complete
MKTSDTEQWGAIWQNDISNYDAAAVLAAVEEESASVRCEKITTYLDTHLGDLGGKHTIEIGCGGAIYSLILARLGARATLLDYSPDALALAERNLGALDLEGELLQADAFNLSSQLHGRFDVAMSFGTVEHYRYPRRLAICQAHVDLAKHGGVVIISVPNVLFLPHEVLKRLLAARGKWFLGYEGSFSCMELRRMGNALGLRDAQIVGSSWRADLCRYVRIVRETRTFRSWFPWLDAQNRSAVRLAQTHHWLDDLLGHDVVLLGVKQSAG